MEIILRFISATAFVWLPVLLFFIFHAIYLEFKKKSYKFKEFSPEKYTLLEINIPKEVHKSPQAMEMIIDVLHHMGGGGMNWMFQYWYGALLYPSSLEIVSIEGNIYFFIRAHKKIATLVKSTIYSQFPQAEVHEVDDYTKYVPNYNYHQESWNIYGADFKLSGPNYLPIKTYIDYQLDDQIGKREEFQKIDPLTPMIEFLSTIGPGEQVWIQYVIRADAMSTWRAEAKEFIKAKMESKSSVDDGSPVQMLRLSHGDQEQIKAVERSLGKLAFETLIRAVYLSKKGVDNPSILGYFKNPVFKPFSSMYFNGIKKNSDIGFDWIWEDFSGSKEKKQKLSFFNDYVNRESFYGATKLWDTIPPSMVTSVNPLDENSPVSVLTSEELATLFHFPSSVSETSSLDRIDATKSEAPQNLPI